MSSVTTSSRRSSSSYRSSSRFSSFLSESSRNGSSDPLDLCFLDSSEGSGLFGEEAYSGSNCLAPFSRHARASYGLPAPLGDAESDRQAGAAGGVRCLGDSYVMSADVSQFEPHDIVVMAYHHHVVIHAEKVLDDGSVSDTFTHKALFPEDMDPLSVSASLNADGNLLVTVSRAKSALETPGGPVFRSEAHL
ncbi:LOW QUALITY PROTEIN: alpha-crystallin A chain [Neosynchiropus ocellatus]